MQRETSDSMAAERALAAQESIGERRHVEMRRAVWRSSDIFRRTECGIYGLAMWIHRDPSLRDALRELSSLGATARTNGLRLQLSAKFCGKSFWQ